jgi:hypothetical protein
MKMINWKTANQDRKAKYFAEQVCHWLPPTSKEMKKRFADGEWKDTEEIWLINGMLVRTSYTPNLFTDFFNRPHLVLALLAKYHHYDVYYADLGGYCIQIHHDDIHVAGSADTFCEAAMIVLLRACGIKVTT